MSIDPDEIAMIQDRHLRERLGLTAEEYDWKNWLGGPQSGGSKRKGGCNYER